MKFLCNRHITLLALLLACPAIFAQQCTVTCDATATSTATMDQEVAFNWSAQRSGGCGQVMDIRADFGDGTSFTYTDPIPNPITHQYGCDGNFNWSLKFVAYPGPAECTAQGNINIVPCEFTCESSVILMAPGTKRYRFVATVPTNTCSPVTEYWWDYGDGTVTYPCEECANVWHNYTSEPPWHWKLTVIRQWTAPCQATCVKEGTIDGKPCLGVGQLALCADSISPPQNGDEYTLSGNVTVNGTLSIDGSPVYKGNPASGSGTLTVGGDTKIALAAKPEVITTGSQVFDVLGTDSSLGFKNDAPLASRFADLPLYSQDAKMKISGSAVEIDPVFYIGNRDAWYTAKLGANVRYTKGGPKEWTGTKVLVGDRTAYYTLLGMNIAYNGSNNTLTGTAEVAFPSLSSMTFKTSAEIFSGCFNDFRFLDKATFWFFAEKDQKLEFSGLDGGLLNLCIFNDFNISMKGSLGPKDIPSEKFSLRETDIEYLPNPNELVIRGGTLALFDSFLFPLQPGGLIKPRGNNYIMQGTGSCPIKDIISGDFTRWIAVPNGDPSDFYFQFTGDVSGKITIPDFPCADSACQTRKAILKKENAIGKAFPLKKGAKLEMKHYSWGYTFSSFYGNFDVWPYRFAAKLRLKAGGVTELDLASNLVNLTLTMPTVEAGAVERRVTLPSGREVAAFSVIGQGALPTIYLKNPGGETITPSNVSSFPGASYYADPAENITLFQIVAPSQGEWIIGEDNLPESEATFTALAQQPPPEVSVGPVTQTGSTVSVTATVTPPGADTKVGLYYSVATDGIPEGTISEDNPATSGTVSASWDTRGVPSGTYYIFATADDGANTPVTAYHTNPIRVDNGGPQPPVNLTGTRSGASATLSWEPSPTQGVTGYEILYTDDPKAQGYPFRQPVASGTSTTIAGLDPEKGYRFCAVALDGQGASSLESNAVTFAKPGGLPGDCDGSGSVSIGEVQKAINMFLGTASPDCGVDCNGDGNISIGEVQKVINAFLGLPSSC